MYVLTLRSIHAINNLTCDEMKKAVRQYITFMTICRHLFHAVYSHYELR